jgi:SWI/SNF-related matrix-associated actin-dependent regulator of chromatin subfamily A3
MDDGSLSIEGVITGHMGQFDCPLNVNLYGTSLALARNDLIDRMKASKLPVGNAATTKKEEDRQAKAYAKALEKARKDAAKAKAKGVQFDTPMAEFVPGSSQAGAAGPSFEEILSVSERFNPRNLENVAEDFGLKEEDLVSQPK